MNKLSELNNLSNVNSLEFSKYEINKMITHYVQDGDYNLNDRADVEAFLETYVEEEQVQLVIESCCSTVIYTLACRAIKETSVVIGILEEEEMHTCASCREGEYMESISEVE